MKQKHLRIAALAAVFAIAMSALFCAQADDTDAHCPYAVFTAEGAEDSFVSYPLLTENSLAADSINRQIMEEAHIEEYIALLGRVSGGGTGLKVTCGVAFGETVCSVVITAEGKMLSGPPAKVFYPMTFDRLTGERLPFEALFSDPERAKEIIESVIEDEIEPYLSDYLGNSSLFPVPYDRYALDGQGHITFYYEKDQLSFLSDDPGALAFRYSELWETLDTSPEAPCMDVQQGEFTDQYAPTRQAGFSLADTLKMNAENGFLSGITVVRIGQPLDVALESLRSTTDSGYYPGGAYYETEASALRGTLLLTDEDETAVTGLLTSRLDCFGIETGKTTLCQAAEMLGEPVLVTDVDDIGAERFLVCAGQAAAWTVTLPSTDGGTQCPGTYTLYADMEGIVRYIGLTFEL